MTHPSICRRGQAVSVISWSDRELVVRASYVLDMEDDHHDGKTYAELACGLTVQTRDLAPIDPSVN